MEERTPEGFLINPDGTIDMDDRKLSKADKAATDGIYKCDLQSGTYILNTSYTAQLDDLLNTLGEDPSDYINKRILGKCDVDENGRIEYCRLYVIGDHVRDKAVTQMSIFYVKPRAVGTFDSGYETAEVESSRIVLDKRSYILRPEAKLDKSVHISSTSTNTENIGFMDTIIQIVSINGILDAPHNDIKQVDARDFVNLYPTLSIYQIDSAQGDNKFGHQITGWMAVIDDEIVGGDLTIHHIREEKRGGDYTTEFRGVVTANSTINNEVRTEAMLELISK